MCFNGIYKYTVCSLNWSAKVGPVKSGGKKNKRRERFWCTTQTFNTMDASHIRDVTDVWLCLSASQQGAERHIISILFLQHIHIWLPCQVMEADETPVSIVSCSAEASKNQLRQKYFVNIKGKQRGFCFWWWVIIHLSTEVENKKIKYTLWLESVLLLANKMCCNSTMYWYYMILVPKWVGLGFLAHGWFHRKVKL